MINKPQSVEDVFNEAFDTANKTISGLFSWSDAIGVVLLEIVVLIAAIPFALYVRDWLDSFFGFIFNLFIQEITMQIVKTFGQSLYEPKFGTRKAVNKTVVIGVYPTLTNDQLVAIVKEYEKNPEPGMYYFVYDETKRDVVYRQGE